MLGLAVSTEIRKLVPKRKVYEHFRSDMSSERRKKFDADIMRMTLINEVSPVSINLSAGDEVQNFFVLHIMLKSKNFDQQNISYLSRLFGQRLIQLLEAEGQARLALWQMKLIMTAWTAPDALQLPLVGLHLDKVWENIVTQIAGIEIEQGRTLDEQIAVSAQREKILKEISKLEKLARAERQHKKKFELAQKIKELKKGID